jgi:hypothetical protein
MAREVLGERSTARFPGPWTLGNGGNRQTPDDRRILRSPATRARRSSSPRATQASASRTMRRLSAGVKLRRRAGTATSFDASAGVASTAGLGMMTGLRSPPFAT